MPSNSRLEISTYADEADRYGEEEREPSALPDAVIALPNFLEE